MNCGFAASPGKLSVRLKNSVVTAVCPLAAAAASNPSVREWLSKVFAAISVACAVFCCFTFSFDLTLYFGQRLEVSVLLVFDADDVEAVSCS